MNWSDEFRSMIAELLTSLKFNIAVAGSAAGLGAAGLMGFIHDLLSLAAIAASVAATVALARYHRENTRTSRLKNLELIQGFKDRGMKIPPDMEQP